MNDKNKKERPSELFDFNGDLSNAIDHFFHSSPVRHFLKQFEEVMVQNAAFPYMDLQAYELEDEVLVEAHLPDTAMQDIDIDVTGRTLTLEIDRKVQHSSEQTGPYYAQSTTYSHFSRSVYLPSEVESSRMITFLKDGNLIIRMPKK
ncbi:Hsp20/alpha crystallin family protein [Metabacillus sp. 84]|uniref:Hsp20/alpha crystallin family protein n=1 Tax=Metabacillus sp. 84 TaxID=3404705 RepID=UPI003CE75230